MKRVILTSGPRGSGKSTYVKSLALRHPEVVVVSRDDILLSLFGDTSIYHRAEHDYALGVMFKELREYLSPEHPASTIILDCWNWFSDERKDIVETARSFGADKVTCFLFVVPVELCVEWFRQKPDVEEVSEGKVRLDHRLYYMDTHNIHTDGFDEVFSINSAQLMFENFPFL